MKKSVFTPAEGASHADISVDNRKTAFTLAEVLITLGIIGVVAAMTLPTIIGNARNKQLETALKRSYSVIGQALDMYQAENGERITPQNTKGREVKTILMKYLHTVRDCGWGFNDDLSCISSVEDPDRKLTSYKDYNRHNLIPANVFDDGQFVLNDGSLVLIENPNGGGIYISVDVNGYNKNPNLLGHDLFMFQIDDKGTFLPMGAEGTIAYSETDYFCSITSQSAMNGSGCTYKALTDKNYFKNLPK